MGYIKKTKEFYYFSHLLKNGSNVFPDLIKRKKNHHDLFFNLQTNDIIIFL